MLALIVCPWADAHMDMSGACGVNLMGSAAFTLIYKHISSRAAHYMRCRPSPNSTINIYIYIYIYSIRVHLAYGHLELDVREDGALGHDRKRFAQQCQAVQDRRLRQLYWEDSNELCVY